jgi:quercetin dioxygenase-like cupin family protein
MKHWTFTGRSTPRDARGNVRRRILPLTALVGVVAFAAFVAVTHAEAPSGVTPTILARGTYDAFDVSSDPHGTIPDFGAHSSQPVDIIVRQHDYAPRSTTGWHIHPGPVFITVTQGQLTFYEMDDPCTAHVVTPNHGVVDSGHGHVVINQTGQSAQDISVITAPVGGAFRTNVDPPAATCGNFAGQNLNGMNLQNAALVSWNLGGSNANRVDFSAAFLNGASLQGANANGANFTGAALNAANLQGANLNGANMTDADLTGAKTAGANLNHVIWSNTTCPDGTNSSTHNGTCANDL